MKPKNASHPYFITYVKYNIVSAIVGLIFIVLNERIRAALGSVLNEAANGFVFMALRLTITFVVGFYIFRFFVKQLIRNVHSSREDN